MKKYQKKIVSGFIISCYRDEKILIELVKTIKRIKNNKIYLIANDKDKFFLKKIKTFSKKQKLFLRVMNSNWGDFKFYDNFINVLKFAINDNCNYLHWIDGNTKVVVSEKKFFNFFKKNFNKTFLEYSKLPHKKWSVKNNFFKKILYNVVDNGINRVKYYHLTSYLNPRKYKRIYYLLDFFFIIFQKLFKINRLFFKNYYGGTGFFSLSYEAAFYLVSQYQKIHNKFTHSYIPEEIITHTILLNSNQYIKKNIINRSLIYQIWKFKNGEIPAVLSNDDLKKIKVNKNKFIFARKFRS